MKFLELEGKQTTIQVKKVEITCDLCEEIKTCITVTRTKQFSPAICEDCINQLAEIIK